MSECIIPPLPEGIDGVVNATVESVISPQKLIELSGAIVELSTRLGLSSRRARPFGIGSSQHFSITAVDYNAGNLVQSRVELDMPLNPNFPDVVLRNFSSARRLPSSGIWQVTAFDDGDSIYVQHETDLNPAEIVRSAVTMLTSCVTGRDESEAFNNMTQIST